AWQMDAPSSDSSRRRSPAEFARQMLEQSAAAFDHLGPLRALLDPPESEFRLAAVAAAAAAAAAAAGTAPPYRSRFLPEFMSGPAAASARRAESVRDDVSEVFGAWPPSESVSVAPELQELLG
ncbi:unnamed protein product, partial [Polarella glacialis]